MLSRKTLGVAGTAILGCMALLVTNTANAAINLTGAADAVTQKMIYASETVLTSEGNVVEVGEAKTKYYVVDSENTGDSTNPIYSDLNIVLRTGIAASTNTAVYLRIELINMVFGSDRAAVTLTSDGAGGGTHLAGGGASDNFVVYTLNAGTTTSEDLTMVLPSIAVLPDMAGSVKVTTHVDTADAIKGEGAIGDPRMASDVVRLASGLMETGTSAGSTAEVSTGFAMFVDGADAGSDPDTTAQIGGFMVGVIATPTGAKVASAQLGAALTLTDILADPQTDHTVTLMGDFSGSEDGSHTFTLQSDMACGDANPVALDFNEAMTETTTALNVDRINASSYLCLAVSADNDVAIPLGDYTATTKFTANGDAAFPVAGSTTIIGSVGRNGTTVQIPYLTTYEGYNQRIVMSNRGSAEAMYEISFRPEAGVTATAKDAATGMLMGNSTVTMKATDVVELSGGSRTAATVDLVAQPRHIDVTSVIVNRESQDTDTVVHHSGM